jgi:hypothetical protein
MMTSYQWQGQLTQLIRTLIHPDRISSPGDATHQLSTIQELKYQTFHSAVGLLIQSIISAYVSSCNFVCWCGIVSRKIEVEFNCNLTSFSELIRNFFPRKTWNAERDVMEKLAVLFTAKSGLWIWDIWHQLTIFCYS